MRQIQDINSTTAGMVVSGRPEFQKLARIVVKVGSSSICHPDGRLDREQINSLTGQVARLHQQGLTVILVLSGAVATGRQILSGLGSTVVSQQAAAAVGQPLLMGIIQQALEQYNLPIAQLLLTGDDLNNRRRYLNTRNTIKKLISRRVLPIINENDTVCTEEIRFSDNDFLAALCTKLITVDQLIILSDIDGIADADPKLNPAARTYEKLTVEQLQDIKKDLLAATRNGKNGSGGLGRGGLATKLEAPLMAAQYGVPSVIANSRTPDILLRLLAGEPLGTLIVPTTERLNSWKAYLAHAMRPQAAVVIDRGAARALTQKKVSLLASGVLATRGQFQRGDGIRCCLEDGTEVARGIVEYGSDEVTKIAGQHSSAIERILGFHYKRGVIHRDNLVITTEVK
ncbi:MAG: glutamate 5-kinase [Candidatus Neomarinimicrobiota bacterium]